jgi:hypothetical protein
VLVLRSRVPPDRLDQYCARTSGPTHHRVYTTANSGAGRLGETATVAEDRCVGGRFPATTQPREGTMKEVSNEHPAFREGPS